MPLLSCLRKLCCARGPHRTPGGFCDRPMRRRRKLLLVAPRKFNVAYKPDNKFHVAACKGNIEKMHSLLVLQRFSINHRDKCGRTALHFACFHGNLEVVAILVESNCEINPCDSQKNTPLMKAVQRQKDKIVYYLLSHGADPNLKDRNGETALHHAIYFGKTVLAETLPDYGADIETITQAVQRQKDKIVYYLLSHGADPNIRDHNGKTPLHHAIYFGRTGLAQKLPDYGADIETMTQDGFTPLLLALRENQTDVAKYLIKQGANVHVFDCRQRNTLMYAVRNDSPDLVHLLLWRGIDFTFSDKFGWTALRYAVTGRRKVRNIMFAYEELLFENGHQDTQNFEDSFSTRTASLITIPPCSGSERDAEFLVWAEKCHLLEKTSGKNITKPKPPKQAETDLEVISLDGEIS